jgi:hypothetical protein
LSACLDDLQLEAEVGAVGGVLQSLRLCYIALKFYGRQPPAAEKSWEAEQLLRDAMSALQESESNYEMVKPSLRYLSMACQTLDLPAVYTLLKQHCQQQLIYLDVLPCLQPLLSDVSYIKKPFTYI